MFRLRSPARSCLASIVVMAVVGGVAPTVAGAAWTAPVTLSGFGAFNPQVAVDPDGDAVFAWEAWDGTNYRIQARRRSAAGALSSIQTLSAAGRDAQEPQVAVDGAGNAIFTWRRSDGTNSRIQARRRSAAGALGPVQTLSEAGQNALYPQVGIDGNGNAIFTWTRSDGTNLRIQARRRSAAGTLGSVQTLSAAGQGALYPQVGIDGNGNAIFTWQRSDGTSSRIQARRRSAAGTLGSILTLSAPGQDASYPQVAVNGAGNAIFTWQRFDGTIQARARSAGGALSTIQTLSAAGAQPYPQVGVDDAGNALFTWTRSDGSNLRVQARRRGAGGALGSILTLSAAGQDAGGPQVAVQGNGNAVFTWARNDGTDPGFCCSRVQARTRSASGPLGSTQTVSAAGEDGALAQVDIDDAGHAVATWVRVTGLDDFDIQAAAGP